MNRTLQNELKKALEAPAPLHKTEFLQKLALQPTESNLLDFFLIQVRYIRKWIWGVSVLIFAVSFLGALAFSADMLWTVSAFMPILALTNAAEMGRSERYEMAELETASRFSLKSVTLALLIILGLGNLLLLALLLPLCLLNNSMRPVQAGLYIITPFLLTAFLCLHIVRRYKGKESIYLCTGLSVCIGLFLFPLRLTLPWLYQENALGNWFFVSALLCIGVIKQYKDLISQEELTWNLS